ncbi:hypothetical protein HD600_002598 [Microbacterium ginsengiterrae]|uniref:YCII-related domain-containing protein n=1 Tax=Microbacterium ginsengiterrae TaxID=546115 RepID=A0A7W9FC82_9MICO|nr:MULTISPECIES: YciI family protein [Microbacterium]MBB5744101.1 hypothetical protein [Microbacterium ginsengiterrae]
MTAYLISFPSGEMDIPDDEFDEVVQASHAVVREAKAAGVWIFGGGIDETVPPVRVAADGRTSPGTYPQTARIDGGYAILDLPTYEEAVTWAAKLARACRCRQELRAFGYDPES